ncbi:hypothetical protein K2X14_07635 [Acetobacter sp. TBRC 12305]|uniref:Electron transfer flavoprotein alpha/beta-subunit N-terminal domain-containing protein n=1 Tax=Acetobacter garciniae TaxID=2817435 RepID=A0A939HP04_9PROT|nr:hypothetical protein [Acetobacter garciniae]MBO1325012.1 hypothetical protein [Acetobacter garciniae]MBX0344703.1 hypothetical protein [Acetobacter garciniae]
MKVAVALSAGVDPISGRAAPVPSEIHAIGLAHQICESVIGVHVSVHAGADTTVLRDYAAYGLNQIIVLEGADVCATLSAWLHAHPDIAVLLTGQQACGGQDSGLVPFLVARRLGWAMVSDVAQVLQASAGDRTLDVLQARPRGVRRPAALPMPCVLGASARTGPVPDAVYAQARATPIVRELAATEAGHGHEAGGEERPWRARPKLLSGQPQGAAPAGGGSGKVLVGPPAAQAAREIVDYLRAIGLDL